MKYYEEEEMTSNVVEAEEEYCDFCWDRKKKKDKELFFFDTANNLRICLYCPNCGRAYKNEA